MSDDKQKNQESTQESEATLPVAAEPRLGRFLRRVETALRRTHKPTNSAEPALPRKALDYANRWKAAGIVCLLVIIFGFFFLTKPAARKPGERQRGKPNLG